MEFLLQILLTLLTYFSYAECQISTQKTSVVLIPYYPETAPTTGNITTTTFTIKQPNCTELSKCSFCNNNPCDVWILVAVNPEGLNDYEANKNLPNLPDYTHYMTFPVFRKEYMTLQTAKSLIICDTSNAKLALMRVGSDNSCANAVDKPNCNGPINYPGNYSAKYVLINPANNLIVGETYWYNFTLKTAKPWQDIDTYPGGRSAGMIVLTVILCVLLFILLLLLIALLIYACTHSVKTQEKYKLPSPQGSIRIARYNTHNMNQQKVPIQ